MAELAGVFDLLPHFLKQNLGRMRIKLPAPVQTASMTALLTGRDAIIQAPTGTGKTLAYLLPLLARIDNKKHGPQALVVVPTRELAAQVSVLARRLALAKSKKRRAFPIMVTKIVGDLPTVFLRRQYAARPPHVLVGTPHSLSQMMAAKPPNFSWAHMSTVVLDEADNLLDTLSISYIRRLIEPRRASQLVVLSATLPPRVHDALKDVLSESALKVTGISLQPENNSKSDEKAANLPSTLSHVLLEPPKHRPREQTEADAWDIALFRRWFSAAKPLSVLGFCSSQIRIQRLEAALRAKRFKVGKLTGDMNKLERYRIHAKLRTRRIQILLSTEMASRGLDIPQLTHVYNFDQAPSSNHYVHRCGRVARMQPDKEGNPIMKQGTVVSPVGSREEYDFLKKIAQECGFVFQEVTLKAGTLQPLSQTPATPSSEDSLVTETISSASPILIGDTTESPAATI